jgi:hypothetical protein
VAEEPQCDPRDGKLRQVIALRDVPIAARP